MNARPATSDSPALPVAAAGAVVDATADAACCPTIQLPPEPRLDLPAPEVAAAVAAAALLADGTRAGIMAMLAEGPHCVCAARHSGDARWIFYERDEERCVATVAAIAGLLR